MKEDLLRKRLLKSKSLFYSIFKAGAKDIKTIIKSATTYECNTILHYLHKLCNGKVRLRKQDFQEIIRKKKLSALRRGLEKKMSLRNAIRQKDVGLKLLHSMAVVMALLLKPLFEK